MDGTSYGQIDRRSHASPRFSACAPWLGIAAGIAATGAGGLVYTQFFWGAHPAHPAEASTFTPTTGTRKGSTPSPGPLTAHALPPALTAAPSVCGNFPPNLLWRSKEGMSSCREGPPGLDRTGGAGRIIACFFFGYASANSASSGSILVSATWWAMPSRYGGVSYATIWETPASIEPRIS